MDYNNGFSLSSFFLLFLSFLWIGAQFPQEKFLSYGRILTLHYYFLLMCILFSFIHRCWELKIKMNSRRLQSLTGKFRPLFSYFEEPEIISQKAVRKRDEGTGESLRKVSSSFSIINSRSSRINVVLVQLILRERPSGTSNSLSLSSLSFRFQFSSS